MIIITRCIVGFLFSISLITSATAGEIFAPAENYFVGGEDPRIVIKGDLNKDGHIDIVTGINYFWHYPGTALVKVFLGAGDGTFQVSSRYNLGYGFPETLNIGDFNGDGNQDIALSVNRWWSYSRAVMVLFGNGDGTFQPQEEFDIADYERFFPIQYSGDFNNDGNGDLAAIDTTNNTVSVSLGNGDGTFQPKRDFATGDYPLGLTVADFNGDLKADLATANWYGGSFSILLGNGDGTFQPKQDTATMNEAWLINSDDFNGDEKMDLVIYAGGYRQDVAVYIGNGDGTFQTAQYYGMTAGYPRAMVTADLNEDGKIDLVTVNYWSSGNMSVFLNISPRLTANAGPDQTIECAGPSGTYVTLDGSGSFDPEGDALTYSWTWDGGSADGMNPTMSLPVGTSLVTLTVSDGKHTAQDTISVTVVDKTPPTLNIFATPNLIWPSNGQFVSVAIGGWASDNCSSTSVVFTVADEYGLVQPQVNEFNTSVFLEAWRNGTDKDGRHYTITATAADASGNKSTASIIILVPHDQR